jgi:hypothetical protein
VTSEYATALFHLRCVWGDAYGITLADGVWSASRLHGAAVVTADSAEELSAFMQSDFSVWLSSVQTAAE